MIDIPHPTDRTPTDGTAPHLVYVGLYVLDPDQLACDAPAVHDLLKDEMDAEDGDAFWHAAALRALPWLRRVVLCGLN